MKKIFRHPLILFSAIVFICYIIAEFIIRGEALNKISGGFAGWLFWGGMAYLLLCFFVLPLLQYISIPVWQDPDTLKDDIHTRNAYLKKYAQFLIKKVNTKQDSKLSDQISDLKQKLWKAERDPALYEAVCVSVKQVHKYLADETCQQIIHNYMRRTAIIVMISQKGWLDSSAMLIMQVKLIIDLCKALGQRPTWFAISGCIVWVITNSIFFALFEETEFFDEAFDHILPENLVNDLSSKISNTLAQGLSAMAIVYATGKAVQAHLLENKKRLSNKERINNRIEGYKEGIKLASSQAQQTFAGILLRVGNSFCK